MIPEISYIDNVFSLSLSTGVLQLTALLAIIFISFLGSIRVLLVCWEAFWLETRPRDMSTLRVAAVIFLFTFTFLGVLWFLLIPGRGESRETFVKFLRKRR